MRRSEGGGEASGSEPGPGTKDVASDRAALRAEIARGLASEPRRLPSRFFYDEEGARLFDEITRLPEYYPTNAEIEILSARIGEIADIVGPGVRIVEYGSGSGEKTWILLEGLSAPAAYVPVDVARRQLMRLAERVAERRPGLEVFPVAEDYTRLATLPGAGPGRATLAFFPGSTIGNLEPDDAEDFLRKVAAQTGPGAFLLIGADLVKDRETLERAYDDAAGVTARFNRNILRHLNRLLGADFDPAAFRHRSRWNAGASRMEMHLVSTRSQTVALGPGTDAPRFVLEEGEVIVTEHSYKFCLDAFREMARRAGYRSLRAWTDRAGRFSVHLFRTDAGGTGSPDAGGPGDGSGTGR